MERTHEWHTKSGERVLELLEVDTIGLTSEEANRRLREYGYNTLPEAKPEGAITLFIRQFQNPLIYVLLVACGLVVLLGEFSDAGVILGVLLINALMGSVQEGRAQNTLRALKQYVNTTATVLRDGEERIIQDREVVPGDILLFREGEKIPADARILSVQNLKIDEAAFTGESVPVRKQVEVVTRKKSSVSEQRNMVFKGTHVVLGNGTAVAVGTGTETEMGKIAKEILSIDTEMPLKTSIRKLSHGVIWVVCGVNVILFLLGVLSGESIKDMFTTVVSLSVSVIPEGLPIVLTMVLATGVWRMSKQHVLVKKLQAVEALGQTSVIAVDKTGTITKNEMMAQSIFTGGRQYEIEGVGYEPKGTCLFEGNSISPVEYPDLVMMGKIASLTASARLMYNTEEKRWHIAGDPTEAALQVFAKKIGFHEEDREHEFPRVDEIPFEYALKYHASLRTEGHHNLLAVTGAPETVLSLSKKIRTNEGVKALTKKAVEDIEDTIQSFSRKGLRVVACAYRERMKVDILSPDTVHSLTFAGLVGIRDTLRPEVKRAMEKANSAGIRVVMITGDHKLTATTIAREAGIFREGDRVLIGEEIDSLTDIELERVLASVSVCARVTPEHKMRIIRAYKRRKEIVAMTGDGVNDAPALVAADLGVGMGRIGTEVAKESADIVLLDDDFGSIVSAVEEGRHLYVTIKKVVLYLFSTSVGEVFTIVTALAIGLPIPLLASQIIWLNFVTDGFLDISLAMEPKERDLLKKNAKKSEHRLVDTYMVWRMIIVGAVMCIGTLMLFTPHIGDDMTKAWTIALTTLAAFQWFNAWNCRHEYNSVFHPRKGMNWYLVGATLIVIMLQFVAVYHPVAQRILHTTALTFTEWIAIIGVASTIIIADEVHKFFYRRAGKMFEE